MKLRNLMIRMLTVAVLVLCGVIILKSANAALIMTITDSSGNDLLFDDSATPGYIVATGEVGLFFIDIQTTASNQATGNLAELVSTSLNLVSSGADYFTVTITESDFTVPLGPTAMFGSTVNASTLTGGASYSAQSLVDGVTLLNQTGITTTGTFTATADMAIGSPFSITHVYTITSTGMNNTISFDLSTRAIPEPAILGLLGLGLMGLGIAAHRRHQVA